MEKNETQEEDKQEPAQDKPEDPVKTEDLGDATKETEPNLVEQAKVENDRKTELLKKEEALMDRKEKLQAEEMVGGHAKMSAPEKPKELTDVEYAEAVERGEKNPLKEDGYIA